MPRISPRARSMRSSPFRRPALRRRASRRASCRGWGFDPTSSARRCSVSGARAASRGSRSPHGSHRLAREPPFFSWPWNSARSRFASIVRRKPTSSRPRSSGTAPQRRSSRATTISMPSQTSRARPNTCGPTRSTSWAGVSTTWASACCSRARCRTSWRSVTVRASPKRWNDWRSTATRSNASSAIPAARRFSKRSKRRSRSQRARSISNAA